jgi:glyoxalase family protein
MDYREGGEEGGLRRLHAAAASAARVVDLAAASPQPAQLGAGSVHHVAFSVADRAVQDAVRTKLVDAGFQVTPPIDRDYFHAIYFRTPGGVLFEVATDGPGFTVDEPAGELGASLKLPRQHEPLRAELERRLPPLA